jgi:hypothetical protein
MNYKRHIAKLAVALAMLTGIHMSAQPTFKFREIARTHEAAPVPAQLSRVGGVSFNNQSQVAFGGDGGLFFQSGGATSIVAALGDHAPGGGTFLVVTGQSMNSNGQIAFTGAVVSPTVFGGLYLSSGGKLKQLIADGAVATSGDIVFPDSPVLNDAGTVAFLDLLTGGLFLDSNGTISPLVRPGDPAPGGDTFLQISFPAINNSGQVVFTAFLASGNQGVFLASGGTITKIAVTGDVFPHGGVFDFPFGAPSINDAGAVAFVAFSNGSVLDEGITIFSGGTLTTVVPSFVTIPSLGAAVFPESASINNAGQIAFIAQDFSLGTTELAVYVFSGGSVTRIITPGQSSPDGDVFSGAQGARINDSGQVAFVSRLLQHNNAIYVVSNNQITRIAGQGDSVAKQPEFTFPFAFGLSNQKQVLLFDETFPGGLGLFTAGPHRGDVSLDAHVGQTIGNDGVVLDLLENFSMNGNGQAVMNSDLSHGVSSIMVSSQGETTQLVRASLTGNGDPTPSGGTLLGVRWSSINNLGQVTFSGFDTQAAGLYMVANGQLTMPVPDSASIPGGPGIFGTISSNSINDHGDIAFLAQAFPVPNGMFLLSNGQFATIARAGDPAPGGGTFDLGFPDQRLGPIVSNDGDVVFGDDLNTGSRTIFLYSKGTLTKLVGPGDPSPDGSTFLSADAPSINSSGEIAFAGVTVANGNGAFLISGGVISKVAVPGDKLHGESLTFVDLPQINDLGDIAFGADILNGDTVVFIARPPKDTAQDPAEVSLEPGTGLFSNQVPLKVMRAKHHRNFKVEKGDATQP